MGKIKTKLPDYIKYKRGNIWIIILGYLFAVIAGVNGMHSIYDIIYQLKGWIHLGLAGRIVDAVGAVLVYYAIHWSFTYMCAKDYTPDKDGVGVYEHLKYDRFTRLNGLFIFAVFLITALLRGLSLPW